MSELATKLVWSHPQTHPLILDLLLIEKYGADWLLWEPEVIQRSVPEDFSGGVLSDLNLSKVQACRALHMVDGFWKDWEIFSACTPPLNGEFPDFDTLRVPTVAYCLVACSTANQIRQDVPWSDELKAYIRTVYEHEGLFFPVAPLDFITPTPPPDFPLLQTTDRWGKVQNMPSSPTGSTVEDEQLRRAWTAEHYLREDRDRLYSQMKAIGHGDTAE